MIPLNKVKTMYAAFSRGDIPAILSALAPDVNYAVEVSSDLLTWTSGPAATVTLTDTPTELVVRDNTPYQDATARYIRLRDSTQ